MINGINKIVLSNGLGYLASPYTKYLPPEGSSDTFSHLDYAAKEVAEIAGLMLLSGIVVISPIASSHAVAKSFPSNFDKNYVDSHQFWMPIDERLYNRCEYGIVAMMTNWELSDGMSMEVRQLSATGKQVLFYDPTNRTLYNTDEARERYSEKFATFLSTMMQNEKACYLRSTVPGQIEALNKTIYSLLAHSKDTVTATEPEDNENGGSQA